MYEYTLIKSLNELCLTVFYLYFIILYDTTGMSHLKVLTWGNRILSGISGYLVLSFTVVLPD